MPGPTRKTANTSDWSDAASFVTTSHVGESPITSLARVGVVSRVPLTDTGVSFAEATRKVFDEAFAKPRFRIKKHR